MKTLHTIYTNFAKHNMASLRLLLVMFLTLTVSANVWADSTPGTGYTLVTDISSLSTNDKVILFCNQNGEGVSGYNGNKDANVSTTAANWIEYLVTKSTNSFTLKDGNKYIAKPGGNEFKYGDSGGECTLGSDGLLICNSRNLMKNGTNYRFYATTQSYTNRFYVYKVAVSYAITAQSNNTTYGTVSLIGTTITASPKTGYRVSTTNPYTVSPTGSATVDQSENVFTVTPTADCTITINFEEKPKYTVTLKDDNSTLIQSTAGGSVTLPTREGCAGYTFAGWTNTWKVAQTTWTTTAPTIIPDGSYTPTANESLYPVYTMTEGGGTSYQFQKVTALSQIKAGGTFIITNGSYYLPNDQASSSGPLKAEMVEVTNGVVTGTVTNAMKWTFSAADANGKITIKSAANSNYYLYTTNSNGGLRVNNTSDTWTFEEYTVSTILGFAMKSTSHSRYCAVYTEGSDWRSYTTKNATNYKTNFGRLDLYKYTEISSNTTYFISVPNCCTQLAEVTGLQFSNITSNSITVSVPSSYSDKANASGYTFNCYSAGGSLVATADENGTSHTFHTFTRLTKNTTYYFTVIAKGEGDYCNSAETSPRESSKTLAQYTITLNPNGGTGDFESWNDEGDGTYTQTVDAGTEVTLPTPSKTGYTFDGWYNNSPLVTSPYTPEEDVTLTAKWTAIEYSITYLDTKGATNSNPTTYTIEDEITFVALTDLPKGYNFTGWDPASITKGNTGYKTITAQWTEKPLTRYRTDCDACIPLDGYAEINGTYHFFPGETITLTVTPPANDVPYTYQWQKFVEDEWEDIDGKTTTTYTKAEATIEDVGHYRCVVSAEGYCDAIAEYNVKCLQLNVYYDDHSFAFTTPLEKVDATTASISVDLQNANYKYYFEITDGCENFYGFNGDIHSGWYENVELNAMNSSTHCGLQTTKFGTYIFTVDHSYLTDDSKSYPVVTVTYPASLQEAGKVIYLDNHVLNWTHSNNADGKNKIYYRIGRNDHNNKIAMALVPGTAALYKVTTTKYDNFDVWHIANNGCWSDNNSIYKTKTGDEWAATQATAFETVPVTLPIITVTPTTLRSVGGEDRNNNCEFYNYDITEGMKTWNAEVIEPTNGTITVKYTHHDGTAVNNFTSGNRDLAHTCLLTITATANEGYSLTSLTVNDMPFTSGNVHTLTADAVIKAEFTINTHTVTWKPAGGNWGGDSDDIVEEYAYGEEIKAPEKPAYDCHEFVAWDPVYTVGMTMPDDDLEFTAQWNKPSYTITFKNYDATVLQTSTVECGETPSYTGATPTREQTAQYTYTFKGWSPTIAPATQDQVYTAQFTQTTRQYTVTWYDGTGNAHKTQSANYNATISVPTTDPDRCDDEYPYFIGWTADPIVGSTTTQPTLVENVKVTGDCDYYAVFAKGEAGGGGSYVLDYTAENLGSSNKWGSYGTAYTHTAKDGSTWVIKAYKNLGMQINTGKNASIKIPSCPSPITSIEITGSTAKAVGLSASDYTGSGTITYIVTGQDNTSQTLDFAGKNVTNGYIVAKSGSISITKITVNFTAPTNYTSFITTCCTSWSAPILTYTTPLEENGTAMPQITGTTHGTVTYESSNPSILSVNSTTGEITAKAPGTAKITATWSGDATYCSVSSTSNVITVKGSFSVIYYSNGGTGTMPNQKADENNVIAQLNANQFTRDGYAFVGWNTKANGTGTAYADQATNITLTGNLTLYAQWAAIVTLNDAGTETTTHPATAGGTITLPDGANACSPYEFVGWTAVATGDWNEGINEPALVATTYTPSAPTTLYAVYKIQSEGNANAFKLSFEGSNGNTYYVDEYSSSPLRGYSNITKDDAVTFIKTKMYPDDDTRYYLYMEEKGGYLYYNGNFNTTSNTPSESQGWIIHTVGDKIKLQSTYSYDPKYLSFSDRDNYAINMDVNNTGSEFNMLPAVTSTYLASPNCNQKITVHFETGNGDFVANAPRTNPLIVTMGETITLPTCEYQGYEFLGWLKDKQQLEPSYDHLTYYTGDYPVGGTSSSITFYAYYKAVPEEVEFTGKDDAKLLMYYYDGTANYYYASSFDGGNGELPSMQNCFNATTWTFTNVGNMQYYIQDETGKYLGAYSDGDNDLILSATPKVWTFTEVNGLWKMVCENSPSRALMYISTGKKFTNAAISNEGNGAYSYVTLGICPYPTYTTNPVLTQGFVVTNTAMVTSAVDQKVKAASALTLETRNIELPCTFTITAPNITFYDNTGAEVTQLTASAASEQFELYFAYQPTAENTMEYPTVTIVDDELKTYTIKNRIQARSLPNTFAIVAKVGGMWYALPSQGLNSTDALVGYPVEVDNLADPTAVTAVPTNADWSLRQVYASSRDLDRFKAGGHNLVFVNNVSPEKALNPSSSSNYLLTNAQYSNYHNATTPGLYEWTPTTTDLETYQLTNVYRTTKQLNIATNTVFGVHATEVVTADVRFLPIQNRYTPMAVQAVEWKENSVVVMYNGDPAQTASVSVNGGSAQTTTLSSAQKDIAVYELTANGLATNPTQSLSITIGTEKAILPIPYIIGSATDDATILGSGSVAAKKEIAKVADLVVLNGGKLTANGAASGPFKFRNVTIYGGGKLVIPSDKGFGVASLTLRAGGITDAGEYDYVYPQFELRGTFTNSTSGFYYDYITDYDHWYHFVLPFAGELGSITYPTEFYGANVTAGNKGSWVIKRYAGEIRATGNYNAWVDIETEGETSTIAGKGYIFWGAPKKVTVNGATARQKWGIQRITMPITAGDAIDAENDKEGGKTISDLGSYEDIANNSGKPNDQGWNLIGNPYMVDLTNMSTSGLHACKLVEVIDPATGKWNGKWDWNDETNIRYLTIPSEHFDTYTAKTVTQAVPLVPGRAFFVQLEGEANGVTFSAANRASLMPQHLAAQNTAVEVETGIVLSNEAMQDEVNLWIKDGKTNEYEYNADYPKTPNSTNFNIYGVHSHGDLSWVAISPEIAEESIAIGYQVPAAGTYMLSISDTYYSDLLEALYVTDHALSPELTTDLMSNPYEFTVNQAETNNTRFTVRVKLKDKNSGTTTGVDNTTTLDSDKPIKFIYNDKIYILYRSTIYDAAGKRVTTINK